jgi:hypothetical protein
VDESGSGFMDETMIGWTGCCDNDQLDWMM